MQITVAITGASGTIYGLRLVKELLRRGDDVSLTISPPGFMVLKEEVGLALEGEKDKIRETLKNFLGKTEGNLEYISSDDLISPLSSGSALVRLMIVCPCSMGTIARIANGISSNLIERVADCMLKEKGKLILVPRETPLNTIHLENMLKLSRMGVSIVPAMPAFYIQPKTVDEIVDFVVGKVLDSAGIDNELYKRWGGKQKQ
jgi:4-hydroxy-3-polyprenylbenzoate decarboxylase